ncbi:MAG: hypothetical protein JST83_04950 [Bacteroidetes bacterium]|nr:hypothetical protein [Bacteroidota bacterium]
MNKQSLIRQLVAPFLNMLITLIVLWAFMPADYFAHGQEDLRLYALIALGWFVLGLLFDLLDSLLTRLRWWRYLLICIIVSLAGGLYWFMMWGSDPATTEEEIWVVAIMAGTIGGFLTFLIHWVWVKWRKIISLFDGP